MKLKVRIFLNLLALILFRVLSESYLRPKIIVGVDGASAPVKIGTTNLGVFIAGVVIITLIFWWKPLQKLSFKKPNPNKP